MDIQDYVRILRQRWYVVVISAVTAVLIVFGVSLMHVPMYETSTRLFVYPQSRVASYAQMMKGGVLIERTLESQDLEMTKPELAEKINATAVPNTMLVRLSVVDQDPERAQKIATSLSNEFVGLVGELEASETEEPDGTVGVPDGAGTLRPGLVPQAGGTDVPAEFFEPTPRVTIETPATVPVEVPTDRQSNLVLAGLVGLLVGVALAVFRDLMDKTVRDSKAAASVTGSGVVGTVPIDPNSATPLAFGASGPELPVAQNYRRLSANLLHRRTSSPTVLMVASPNAGEGAYETAVNTALALAEAGRGVCLVETELRTPRLAETFDVAQEGGLAAILSGEKNLNDALTPSGYRGLTVLPAGEATANPSESLASSLMRQAINDIRGRYEYVVLTAPAMLPLADAAVLAAMSDCVLLVVRRAKTTKAQLSAATEALNGVGADIVGVVLTESAISTGRSQSGLEQLMRARA